MSRKKFRIILGIALMLLVVASLPGCSQPVKAPDYADAMTETVLLAFNAGDYPTYSQYFVDSMKEALSETVFEGTREFIRDRVGDYISKEVTAVDVVDNKTTVTYTAKFSDEPDNVKVTFVFFETGGNVYISGLWYDSPKLRKMSTGG
jgi:hypothetical protein